VERRDRRWLNARRWCASGQTGVAPSLLISASPSALVMTAYDDFGEVTDSSLRNNENLSSIERRRPPGGAAS